MPIARQLPRAVQQLELAFRAFNDASLKFSEHYARLERRIEQLNLELEEANNSLRENLKEKEEVQAYLSTVLESLPVGVIGIDRAGAISSCNRSASEILECNAEDAIGLKITGVFTEMPAAAPLERAIAGQFQRHDVFEIATQGFDGRRRVLNLQIVPANRKDDDEAAGVLLIEDVTEMRRLEHQASRTNRLTAMGEIAMNVAHEIRNPLGSIELFASMLARDLAEDSVKGPLAAHICTGVRCVDHIVANILQFSRPQRLSCTSFDLNDLVSETLVFAEHALRQKDIEVERHFGKKAFIVADAELLKQMLLNLFLNAVQATPENGRVGVSILPVEKTVEIRIWDTGSGLPREIIGKIFDPFFTTRRKGTGLGLTIVHNIVSAHQGSIEAENRPEGGALFTITLPRKAQALLDGAEVASPLSQIEERSTCRQES